MEIKLSSLMNLAPALLVGAGLIASYTTLEAQSQENAEDISELSEQVDEIEDEIDELARNGSASAKLRIERLGKRLKRERERTL